MSGRYIQVQTTVASRADAEKIARVLIQGRLAACVQIAGPIASTYWWKGAIETAEEWLCFAKTRADLYAEVEAAIKSVHPYEVPEIFATEIVGGSRDYLRWIRESTNK
jgi:periplasmic divalent cation tolerance protein